MSWLFSQALVAEYSAANSSDGGQFAQLNVMPTQHKFWRNDKTMEFSRLSQFGLTCAVLTESRGVELLTSYLAAFPARTSALQERAPESQESAADCGQKWRGSLAKYDPVSRSLKTAQLSLIEDLTGCSPTLPRWGSMRSGECLERDMLAHVTDEIASGFVPTVLTSEATGPWLHGNGSHNFRTWFRENSTERRLPLHGEIMMLWPLGWANAGRPLGTGRYQQWQQQHSVCSQKEPELSEA